MRPIGFGCLDHNHPHEIIVAGRSVGPALHPAGILTLWRCPVLHTLGGYWNDTRRRAEDIGGTGPSLEVLPVGATVTGDAMPAEADAEAEDAPRRRRLLRRD